jgi:hypothetical protein
MAAPLGPLALPAMRLGQESHWRTCYSCVIRTLRPQHCFASGVYI